METYHPSERPHTRPVAPPALLPNHKGVFAVGLIGLILSIPGLVTFFCVPAIVLGIVAQVLGRTAKTHYHTDPEKWDGNSFQKVRSGQMLGLIALILGTIGLVINVILLILLTTGSASTLSPFMYSIF